MAKSRSTLARAHLGLGDYETALEHAAKALAVRRRIDDQAGVAETLITVAGVHLGLRMPFAVVDMVHVVAVERCLAAVVRQVLVIGLLGVRAHFDSSGSLGSHLPPVRVPTTRVAASPDRGGERFAALLRARRR